MKKISLMLMAFGLVATSCTKSEFDTIIDNSPKAKFSQEFANAYGTIAPNQDWGFSSNAMRSATDGQPYYERWQSDRSWIKPHDIIETEKDYVLQYLQDHPNGGYKTLDIDTYVIQVVGGGKHDYKGDTADHNGTWHTVTNATNHMNKCYINGFFTQYNNGHEMNSEDCILIGNVLATDATYQESYSSNETVKDHYAFYFITFPNEDKYGYMAGQTGCYLCYDFTTYKSSEQWGVTADGKYDDWVIKLSGAYGNPIPEPDGSFKFGENARRIIAEDLAASDGSDFDYNDVVFDAEVRYENGKYIAYIQLLAAGGTIQLTVGGRDVHEAFGVPTTTMVNTHAQNGEDGATAELYTYEIVNPSATDDLVKMLLEIPIEAHVGSTSYTLDAVMGQAAEKIAVGRDYEWTDERKAVETKHPGFLNYANHPENTKWWN